MEVIGAERVSSSRSGILVLEEKEVLAESPQLHGRILKGPVSFEKLGVKE